MAVRFGAPADVQPTGRIDEDQAVALGELEQRPQRRERARALVSMQAVEYLDYVLLGDLA